MPSRLAHVILKNISIDLPCNIAVMAKVAVAFLRANLVDWSYARSWTRWVILQSPGNWMHFQSHIRYFSVLQPASASQFPVSGNLGLELQREQWEVNHRPANEESTGNHVIIKEHRISLGICMSMEIDPPSFSVFVVSDENGELSGDIFDPLNVEYPRA